MKPSSPEFDVDLMTAAPDGIGVPTSTILTGPAGWLASREAAQLFKLHGQAVDLSNGNPVLARVKSEAASLSASIPTSRSTSVARVACKAERVTIKRAGEILGLATRTVQRMSQRGELPGAALIGRLWTYNADKLHGYVRNRERETWHAQKHRLDVIGTAIPSTVASRLKARPSDGRFARAIRQLRSNAEKRAKPER